MRPQSNGYVLKEYGSWSVLVVSYLIGLTVSRSFPWRAVPAFVAIALLINSKQAYTKWMRRSGGTKALSVFLVQVGAAAIILLSVYQSGLPQLLPLLVFPAAYLVTNRLAGEHFVLTELLGFCLLSLSAVLAKFLVVQGVDVRLFVATALYFTAGVFKVKAVLFRSMRYRVLTVLYVLFALYAYGRFHISWLILLPLAENVAMAVTLYKVRLRITGWIEVAKSLVFLGCMAYLF